MRERRPGIVSALAGSREELGCSSGSTLARCSSADIGKNVGLWVR